MNTTGGYKARQDMSPDVGQDAGRYEPNKGKEGREMGNMK